MAAGDQTPRPLEGAPPSATAPHRVVVPVNIHRWERISFLHWSVDPEVLCSSIPAAVTPLTYGGKAWVGVTPFHIEVRPFAVPVVPPWCAFPETNLRTYVAGPDGREGLWFLHQEVTAAWFVTVLRAAGLPYVRREMSVSRTADGAVVYESRGSHHIVVRPGDRLEPVEGGPRERFLTARWRAYHRLGPVLLQTPVQHPSWTLHAAAVEHCDVAGLFRSAGLPEPTGPPVAHYSPGLRVKVGCPRIVR